MKKAILALTVLALLVVSSSQAFAETDPLDNLIAGHEFRIYARTINAGNEKVCEEMKRVLWTPAKTGYNVTHPYDWFALSQPNFGTELYYLKVDPTKTSVTEYLEIQFLQQKYRIEPIFFSLDAGRAYVFGFEVKKRYGSNPWQTCYKSTFDEAVTSRAPFSLTFDKEPASPLDGDWPDSRLWRDCNITFGWYNADGHETSDGCGVSSNYIALFNIDFSRGEVITKFLPELANYYKGAKSKGYLANTINKIMSAANPATVASEFCSDGQTAKGDCKKGSAPNFCNDNLGWGNDCKNCGCPNIDYTCNDDGSCTQTSNTKPPCSDGTVRGTCNEDNAPKFCNDQGKLVDSCGPPGGCGCPNVTDQCNPTGGCSQGDSTVSKCSDGTIYGSCSATEPYKCENGTLVKRCNASPIACGCPNATDKCNPDGTCSAGAPIPASPDNDKDKYSVAQGDCDDSNPNIKPVADNESIANGNCSDLKDNDCDGVTDAADGGCSESSGGTFTLQFFFNEVRASGASQSTYEMIRDNVAKTWAGSDLGGLSEAEAHKAVYETHFSEFFELREGSIDGPFLECTTDGSYATSGANNGPATMSGTNVYYAVVCPNAKYNQKYISIFKFKDGGQVKRTALVSNTDNTGLLSITGEAVVSNEVVK